MDFSSQLANFQKTASDAQRGKISNSNSNNYNNRSNNGNNRSNSKHRSRSPPHRQHPQTNHQPRDAKRQRRLIEGPYRNPKWNVLKIAMDSLPKYQPPDETKPVAHLCLLAVTINELPFEAIWRDWAARQSVKVSLICHAKEPHRVQSEWLKSRLLVEPPQMGRGNDYAPPTYRTYRPRWGSIEITRAMLDLCHESLKIGVQEDDPTDPRFAISRYGFHLASPVVSGYPPVDKILFISETCLPIASLTGDLLTSLTSIVNSMDKPNNGFSRQLQFDKIHSLVPIKRKADQWMMLSRPHVEFIINKLPFNFWECFQDCNASDELYFPTALALLGIGTDDEPVPEPPQLIRRRITYADWSMGPKNPTTFEAKDLKRVVEEAQREGCLVARKFVAIELEEWKAVVFPS